MQSQDLESLEWWLNISGIANIVAQTRKFLASSKPRLAVQIADHLSAYNSTSDVVPFFGDYRLAHTEALFQLQNSVCLAFHGFYSQAFTALRSVCELSLLQSSLPEGATPSGAKVNMIWLLGQRAASSPSPGVASSLKTWAIDGCRIPRWKDMLKKQLNSDMARWFDQETKLSARLKEMFESLNQYIHVRGWQRSAIHLGNGSLRFSEESFSVFGTIMMHATQLSISILLLAFLPMATSNPEAAAGFIDDHQLLIALRVLPKMDAELLRQIFDKCDR